MCMSVVWPHMLAICRVDGDEVCIAQVGQTERPQPVQVLSVLARLPQYIGHAAQEEPRCTHLHLRFTHWCSATSHSRFYDEC